MLAKEFRHDLHDPRAAQSLAGSRYRLGGNFLTPEVVAVYRRGPITVEVSAGDWNSGRIFGVTVWGPNLSKFDPDPSQGGFHTLSEALEHAEAVLAGKVTA